MELTGKCKVDFEKWYELNISEFIFPLTTIEYSGDGLGFKDLSTKMKYGVYVDFFDSVGRYISLNQYDESFWFDIEPAGFDSNYFDSRQEARISAIKESNKIHNKI